MGSPINTDEGGVSLGSALAMAISFCTWKSVGWAILHGILGWIYVIYMEVSVVMNRIVMS